MWTAHDGSVEAVAAWAASLVRDVVEGADLHVVAAVVCMVAGFLVRGLTVEATRGGGGVCGSAGRATSVATDTENSDFSMSWVKT